MAGLNLLKRCPYCSWLYPRDQFVKLKRGRGGRTTVIMCLKCRDARHDPEGTKARLDLIIASKKGAPVIAKQKENFE